MKINWKVRLQNGPFLMGVASAVIMFVFYMLDMFGIVTSVTAEQIMQGVQLLLLIPAAIGIISDPTTKGINDSSRALTYERPKIDKVNK